MEATEKLKKEQVINFLRSLLLFYFDYNKGKQGRRKKEDELEFNKDAALYDCKAGHMKIRKERAKECY